MRKVFGALLLLLTTPSYAAMCGPSEINGHWVLHFDEAVTNPKPVRLEFGVTGNGSVGFTLGGWKMRTVTKTGRIKDSEVKSVSGGMVDVDGTCLVNGFIDLVDGQRLRLVTGSAMSDDGLTMFGTMVRSRHGGPHFFPVAFTGVKR